ncbi:hypothetical protein KC356_g1654 [Hortaea werneckii]|nr:hypothetical protein KC356_g1654 [Hortaea werneckii]
MAGDDLPSNVTAPRPIQKRKRPQDNAARANKSARTSTPNAYARRTPPPEPRPIDPEQDGNDGDQSPPRKLKRPGAGARMAREQRQAAEAVRHRREEDQRRQAQEERQRSGADLVAEHYNAVPQLGREWRKTDSQIKGLRNLNNWIKSTLIQKFARPEIIPQHGYLVLDMACGKGGDLGKWSKASPPPGLYVGCDIADVSIEQARGRWAETRRKVMDAEFYVQDTFGRPLFEVPIVRQVGFNPNCGPGNGIIQGGMPTGGFDVVSMMFALHYSFEREDLARGMLKNVAGALKKGGRFIGCMPNSDVISATVKRLLQAEAPGTTPARKSATPGRAAEGDTEDKEDGEEDDWDPEKPADADEEDDWDPEKPSEPQQPTNDTPSNPNNDEEDDDWDPEKPSEPTPPTQAPQDPSSSNNNAPATDPSASTTPAATDSSATAPPLEWGNSLYKVSFPRHQPLPNRPLPRDGTFRPPYGWKYFYHLAEAVNAPEYVVPWEGFRALAEEYGLELMYRKGFREVLGEVHDVEPGVPVDRSLTELAERMGVLSRDRSAGRDGGLLVSEDEMEAAGFYHAFCFYKT